MLMLYAETRRNWSRSPRTSFWLEALGIWRRCNRRPAPSRLCSSGLTDPVGAGFVESLARPGGNTTGFTSFEYGLSAKWVELLKEIAPRVTRVGVLREQGSSVGIGLWAAMQGVAPSLGMELRPIGAREAPEIERGVAAFARGPNGGMIVTVGGLSIAHRDLISTLAARHQLPAIYPFRYFVTSGGLMSYGPDQNDQYRRAAGYVDRILKGEKPADLPVQAPTKYELVINLKTAKALGLTVPPYAARARRRGDRIAMPFAALPMSPIGTSQPWQLPRRTAGHGSKADAGAQPLADCQSASSGSPA